MMIQSDSIFIVSDRGGENFLDPNYLSEQSQCRWLKRDGTSESVSTEDQDLFFDSLKGKRILFVMHGYNSTGPLLVNSYYKLKDEVEKLESDLGSISNIYRRVENYFYGTPLSDGPYDAVVGYVWPGYEAQWSYLAAKQNVELLVPRVKDHITHLSQIADKVDVVAHSMGNLALFKALDQIDEYKKPVLRNIFALAPAINFDALEEGHEFYNVSKKCEDMYVFTSENDSVLRWLYPVVEMNYALGYCGTQDLEKIARNIQVVNCTSIVEDHGHYPKAQNLYHFIQETLNNRFPSTNEVAKLKINADKTVTILYSRQVEDKRNYYLNYIKECGSTVIASLGNLFSYFSFQENEKGQVVDSGE